MVVQAKIRKSGDSKVGFPSAIILGNVGVAKDAGSLVSFSSKTVEVYDSLQ